MNRIVFNKKVSHSTSEAIVLSCLTLIRLCRVLGFLGTYYLKRHRKQIRNLNKCLEALSIPQQLITCPGLDDPSVTSASHINVCLSSRQLGRKLVEASGCFCFGRR